MEKEGGNVWEIKVDYMQIYFDGGKDASYSTWPCGW